MNGQAEQSDRPLRVFAFDPSRGRGRTNIVTLRVPYEPLQPGPEGRYVAVVDRDESRGVTYPGVDLDSAEILMQGGLEPSEVDLRFHQQMVYAVASGTIRSFERALGRPIRWPWAGGQQVPRQEDKLRIHPHGMQEANAWADPASGELFFGYDHARGERGAVPGQIVYTCLSHDIVAHETVHPLLASLFPPFQWGTNPETEAFHEGFADLVTVLQHFDFEDALRDAIARTDGRIYQLETAPDARVASTEALILAQRTGTNPLLEIGRQFGQAEGLGGPLRLALQGPPDPEALKAATGSHERGAFLVSAVVDAMLTIYARRTEDLARMGGVRSERDRLHPDLIAPLAGEAAKSARQFLTMCIRALDYLPPVDPGFGDFLRAVVTSDADLVPADDWGYREAIIESFRARGVDVGGAASYSPEGLRWPPPDQALPPCQGLSMEDARAPSNARRLLDYARRNRDALGLRARWAIRLDPGAGLISHRVTPEGRLVEEFVVRLTQTGPSKDRIAAATTLILDHRGIPRYVIGPGGSRPTSRRRGRIPAPPRADQVRTGLARRPLKVFAFDPTRGRAFGNHLAVTVPLEVLSPGPVGRQVAVVDYDATNDRYHRAVDLDDPSILLRGGLEPSDVDPAFHQQMCYAAVAGAVERFELGLGRPVLWPWAGRGQPPLGDRLRVYPHAMQEANAYYDRDLRGLLFGYFAASRDDPGSNLPGQIVHTCLSHDIVLHETTHALLDSVRRYFLEPTGPDAPAFHEAFADVMALLQHFSVPDALRETIERTGGRIHRPELAPESEAGPGGALTQAELAGSNPLVDLARQFGEAQGARAALRSALGTKPDTRELETTTEPHARGAILVAAIFDAFFSVYLRRTADLLRVGRAGGAVTDWGDLHPDLAARLAKEATKTADRLAAMCVRAIDYCPPVRLDFGDFLRALVTADLELEPDDPLGHRAAVIAAFASRGIYPAEVRSLSEEGLRWEALVPDEVRCEGLDLSDPGAGRANAIRLNRFAHEQAAYLGLSAESPIRVDRLDAGSSRQADDHGRVRSRMHVQVVQQRTELADPTDPDSSFVFRGGATVVLDQSGAVRYLIRKGIRDPESRDRQRDYLLGVAGAAPSAAYLGAGVRPMSLAALHRGFEGW